ncbi:MAG TPA: hypothetical protein VFQ87_18410 [Bradyrhizobium sp.]|jgi:hypothetical protein|nr:hypothetical protein [Bradyrhizobium sp.]
MSKAIDDTRMHLALPIPTDADNGRHGRYYHLSPALDRLLLKFQQAGRFPRFGGALAIETPDVPQKAASAHPRRTDIPRGPKRANGRLMHRCSLFDDLVRAQ